MFIPDIESLQIWAKVQRHTLKLASNVLSSTLWCYFDLEVYFQSLLLDSTFSSECELWKTRDSNECLKDVYDGRVWKTFMEYEGKPVLVYALMINIDWFQPYIHLTYSVGAIYLSVFNLPRHSSYKLHNICLVGIIPCPCEPELTVNQYINPLVDELRLLWSGWGLDVRCGSQVHRKLVRCAVIIYVVLVTFQQDGVVWILRTQCPFGLF